MDIKPQNVLDYHGNNAIFMVWNFKKDLDFKDAFRGFVNWLSILIIQLCPFSWFWGKLCKGIGYNAWLDFHLPIPIPKELENFAPIVGEKHTAVSTKGDCIFISEGIVLVYAMIWHMQYLTFWNQYQHA